MNKKMYMLLIIIVVGAVIAAGIMAMPKQKPRTQSQPSKVNGVLVLSTYLNGTGTKKIDVDKTWAEIYVTVIYDPMTLKNDSYVDLVDPNGHTYNLGVKYKYVSPGVRYSSSQTVNLNLPPPFNKGPFGKWEVVYDVPLNAYVHLKIYKVPMNETSS